MGWLYIALLAAAVLLVAAAEWPRLEQRFGGGRRERRKRQKRKTNLRLVRDDEADEFAASVQRDLDDLPTIDPRERR